MGQPVGVRVPPSAPIFICIENPASICPFVLSRLKKPVETKSEQKLAGFFIFKGDAAFFSSYMKTVK